MIVAPDGLALGRKRAAERRIEEPEGWAQRLLRPHILGLGLVLLLAAAMRLWGLGRESIWWDEAYSIAWSQHDLGWLLDYLRTSDVHPPAYYAVLHGWVVALGPGVAETRLLSALLGLAGIAAAYLLGRDMFRPRVGVLFALFVAVSEFHLYYSQEVRSYIMLFAASVVSMHAYWQLFHRPDAPRLGWRFAYYVAATTLLLYTHFTGVFVVVAQVAHRAIILANAPDRKAFLLWAASQALVAALFLPWFLVLLEQAARVEQGFWIPKPTLAAGQRPPDFSVGGTFRQFTGGGPRAWVAWLLVGNGLAASTLATLNRERNPDDSESHRPYPAAKVLLLVAWLLCSVLLPFFQSMLSQPIYLSRIVIPALAPLWLLAAVGVARLRLPAAQTVAAGLVVALAVPGLADYYTTDAKERWDLVVAAVEEGAAPNATVVLVGNAGNPWAVYAERPDLRTVRAGTAQEVANQTAGESDVWLVSRQDPACGQPSPLVSALGQGRRLVSCEQYMAQGLRDFPLAANPLYVHHFSA